MITITGKINLFTEDKTFGEGANKKTIRVFKTNISTKKEDGTYIRLYKDVVLSSKSFPTEKTSKLDPEMVYEFEIAEGWLNVRSYLDASGNERKVDYIFINKGKLTKATKIDQEKRAKALASKNASRSVENKSDDDLPF